MRKLQRALLAAGLGFTVSLVAGCGGGSGLLTGNQASGLQNQLSQVSSALSAGHCTQVRTATEDLVGAIANLPASVNDNLRVALGQEASRVSALAVQQCHPVAPTTPTTTPTTPTTPTNTTTTPATTTTTTPTTPTTPTNTTTTPATTTTTPGTNTTGSSGGGGLGGTTGSGGGAGGNGSGAGNG
jgi:hypothetical protein